MFRVVNDHDDDHDDDHGDEDDHDHGHDGDNDDHDHEDDDNVELLMLGAQKLLRTFPCTATVGWLVVQIQPQET